MKGRGRDIFEASGMSLLWVYGKGKEKEIEKKNVRKVER